MRTIVKGVAVAVAAITLTGCGTGSGMVAEVRWAHPPCTRAQSDNHIG